MNIIKNISPTALTMFIAIIMLSLFFISFFVKRDFKHIIISLGIFGTFSGILIGLLNFNSTNITESVPLLLDGLKVAFTTSVLGMLLTLILNFLRKQSKEDTSSEEILSSILQEQKESRKDMIKFRENLGVVLSRIDISLKKSLDKISEGATKEIISALELVIKEFNNNLTEQFGDNFKQLNEAVHKMIHWQENYKSYIETLEENIKSSIELLKRNAAYNADLKDNFQKIYTISTDMSSILQSNENQIKNLEIHLGSLKKIGDEAGLITKSIDDFSKSIKGSLSEQSEGLNVLSDNLKNQLEGSLGNLEKTLVGLTDKFRDDYNGFLKIIKELQGS